MNYSYYIHTICRFATMTIIWGSTRYLPSSVVNRKPFSNLWLSPLLESKAVFVSRVWCLIFEDYCSHFSIFGHQTAVDVFDVLKIFIDFGVLGPT